MHEIGQDLWKIAKELRGSEVGSWLTLLASTYIVIVASLTILLRVSGLTVRLLRKFRGNLQDAFEYPEGA